jgi:hypothetical protein
MRNINTKVKVLSYLSIQNADLVPLEGMPFADSKVAEEMLKEGLIGVLRTDGKIKWVTITRRGMAIVSASKRA